MFGYFGLCAWGYINTRRTCNMEMVLVYGCGVIGIRLFVVFFNAYAMRSCEFWQIKYKL